MTIPSQKRLRFDRAQSVQEAQDRYRVTVSFTFADRVIETSSEGAEQLRAAAEAALMAIELAVEKRFTCKLTDLDHINALGKDLIAVLVDIDFEEKQVQVFGSCQLAGSEIDAAVKAALNATNRFFELAMRA
ncbi:MAG TPA: hypothetical protein VJQ56_15820 [Blastocatellia bacterium]|nr:hypothetical protein [Blastocatellia bacterium]